jgi:acyl-coenzyme A thioesterase PaaI-like protein
MPAAELDAFLRTELPQMFNYDDLRIEHAEGQTCRVRQRFRESMLRPGGTISGPTLMALADCAMYVVLNYCRRSARSASQ